MGWASRAKRRDRAAGRSVVCGNPAPAPLTARAIDAGKFEAARKAGHALKAVFSDRAYRVDMHGTLRRVRPAFPTMNITVTRPSDPAIEK